MGNYYYETKENSMVHREKFSGHKPLQIRVFYVRISKLIIKGKIPECLKLNLIPLSSDTILKVNGAGCPIQSEGISCILRKDRVDEESEEVTFVGTDSISSTDSVMFEVLHKDSILINGVLDLSSSNSWSMTCEFLKGRQKFQASGSHAVPALEVYVAGCFLGSPVVLTKSLQLNRRRNGKNIGVLNTIPEYEDASESHQQVSQGCDLQISNYRNYEAQSEEDYYDLWWSAMENKEAEDWEFSRFNAGVRVGVGLGLSLCLGVGVSIGLLVRTYQTNTRTLKRGLFKL